MKPARQTFHPVDRGWSWMIMIASFGVHFVTMGYLKSFGLLIVEFQEKLGSSATQTSTIKGVQEFCYCFLTLLVTNYGVKRMSIRTLSILGVLLETLSVAISGFLPNGVVLIFTLGAIFGCGNALLYCPTLIILSQYFKIRRPLATSIAACGSSVGGIAFPALTNYLLDRFGLQGTTLLLSGIMLQQMIFVIVYTPPSDYQPMKAKDYVDEVEAKLGTDNGNGTQLHSIKSPVVEEEKQLLANLNGTDNGGNLNQLLLKNENSKISETVEPNGSNSLNSVPNLKISRENSTENKANHETDLTDINERYSLHPNEDTLLADTSNKVLPLRQETDTNENVVSRPLKPGSCFKIKVPAIMKLPTFWVLAIYYMFAKNGTVIPTIYLPTFARERNLSHDESALVLMLSSSVDIAGKILSGLILHFKILKPTSYMIIPLVCMGVIYNLTPLFTDFNSIVGLGLAYGLLCSSFWPLLTLIVIEVLGSKRLPSALGYYSIFMSLSGAASFPISGALRDATGTYTSSFHFFGALYLTAALSLVCVKFMIKKKDDNEKKATQ
ncbi:unnamed protein product [Lymnaea stagnalis]|uniref:Uncharacterized protein n=1 Tax=Lymnaea stagnalis TaxID=6523 RepID=A0AAV2HBW0_LYMST